MKLSIKGGDWNAAKFRKKGRASRTAGKTKGETCTTDARKKYLLTHPHAHRNDPAEYSAMHTWAKNQKGNKT